MFKFETIVYLMLVICVATSSRLSLGEPTRSVDHGEEYCKIKYSNGKEDEFFKCIAKVKAARSSGSEECSKAENNFSSASGKFAGACNAAGLERDPNSGESEGAIGCSWSLNRCICTNKKLKSDHKAFEKYRCDDSAIHAVNLEMQLLPA